VIVNVWVVDRWNFALRELSCHFVRTPGTTPTLPPAVDSMIETLVIMRAIDVPVAYLADGFRLRFHDSLPPFLYIGTFEKRTVGVSTKCSNVIVI
jgi:hypothetical protein